MNSSETINCEIQKHKKHNALSFYLRLFILYALNLADWLCTEVLISSGRFFEVNPIMSPLIQNFLTALLIKAVLPFVLIILCAVMFRLSGSRQNFCTGFLLNTVIIAYALVILWHIVNFVLLFSA